MSADEMEALLMRGWKKFILVNTLWILFLIIMIFLFPVFGVILFALTALKYLYDYHDVDSQNITLRFMKIIGLKRSEKK